MHSVCTARVNQTLYPILAYLHTDFYSKGLFDIESQSCTFTGDVKMRIYNVCSDELNVVVQRLPASFYTIAAVSWVRNSTPIT